MTVPDARLGQLARAPQLLVACDYDGTIAPIVDDPMDALPNRETAVALRNLADMDQTHVAVISGRALRDLAALSRLPVEIHLVGSHGSEFDVGFHRDLSPEAEGRREEVGRQLQLIADELEGAELEDKPAAVAFHYRQSEDQSATERALAAIEEGPACIPGVRAHRGDKVVELLVIDTDKGAALNRIRRQVGATAVIYIGDSPSDEHALATLTGPDIGVKVGDSETVAEFRVADPDGVAVLIAHLADLRRDWLAGAGVTPIEQHSMLSDQRTAAIVTPDARITWLCLPRIDSSAVFAELVGGPVAGYFAIRPDGTAPPSGQRYVGHSLVLETSWPSVTVTDYLDCSGGRPERLAGRSDLIRVVEGSGRVRIEFAPRLDFGRLSTRLERRSDGIEVMGTTDLTVLRAPGVEWEIVEDGIHQTACADVDLAGDPVVLELRCGTASMRPESQEEPERRSSTEQYWASWAEQLEEATVEPELVRRSALTLKALCHRPTGAIVAAATTSLPEHFGGVRNWDYRYCWLRDSAMSATALVRLGSYDEAMALLDWVLHILELRDEPERLRPLYLVTGRHLAPEGDLAELAGYAGSRPVRVGNAADRQVQLDVFGPIVELVYALLLQGAPLATHHWRLVQAMVQAVERRWTEPDNGIWEIRLPPRHHVHTKTMCWLTVDRAITVADRFTDTQPPEWIELRERIATDVLDRGYNPGVGAFTAAYDFAEIDAASLAVGLSGLIPPDDERFASTVEAVETQLREGPTVYRYRMDDGLPGDEGGFHLMTSWLIDAYLVIGRVAEARALFGELCKLVGPTQLMSEEYDPVARRALGNHPQAYSHLGLINNALNIALFD